MLQSDYYAGGFREIPVAPSKSAKNTVKHCGDGVGLVAPSDSMSSHKWTGTGSGTIDWVRLNVPPFRNVSNFELVVPKWTTDSICLYLLSDDKNLKNVAQMHLLFDDAGYSVTPTLAVVSITFCFVADAKCGLNEICYTLTQSGPKNVPRPNRSDVGPETTRTKTWTCTKSTGSQPLL